MLSGRIDAGVVSHDLVEGVADLFCAGVLGQVAAGTGPEGVADCAVVGIPREPEHFDVRVKFTQTTSRFDAIAAWHVQIHENDVGTQAARWAASSPSPDMVG
jgi:hypothetical protein